MTYAVIILVKLAMGTTRLCQDSATWRDGITSAALPTAGHATVPGGAGESSAERSIDDVARWCNRGSCIDTTIAPATAAPVISEKRRIPTPRDAGRR